MDVKVDFRPFAPHVLTSVGWTDGHGSDVELMLSSVPQSKKGTSVSVCIRLSKEQAAMIEGLLQAARTHVPKSEHQGLRKKVNK